MDLNWAQTVENVQDVVFTHYRSTDFKLYNMSKGIIIKALIFGNAIVKYQGPSILLMSESTRINLPLF